MPESLSRMARELSGLAWIVMKLAGRDLERRLGAYGVIPGRALAYGVLRLLRDRAYTSSELSRHMMLTPATLVPVVDALERAGLIKRGHDPADRRRAPLALTRRGAEVLARVPVVGREDALVRGLRRLAAEERQLLHRLLGKLVREMAGSERQRGAILAAARAARERAVPATRRRLQRGA